MGLMRLALTLTLTLTLTLALTLSLSRRGAPRVHPPVQACLRHAQARLRDHELGPRGAPNPNPNLNPHPYPSPSPSPNANPNPSPSPKPKPNPTITITITISITLTLTRPRTRCASSSTSSSSSSSSRASSLPSSTRLTRTPRRPPCRTDGLRVPASRAAYVTGGAGRLVPRAPRTVRTGYACQPRPFGADHVPWLSPQVEYDHTISVDGL